MTGTRISFVVASYNGATYIEEQLESILAALGPNDEIVISDDGSSDDTVDRVQALQEPRITLLSGTARLGYQGNFARAVAATRGRFIFFSDQDDVCLPQRVPLSLAALQHSACVCGDAIVVDSALVPIQESHFRTRRAKFSTVALILRPAVIGATLACRRTFLLANLPFPVGVPHDSWLSVQAARHGELAVIRDPFILYRRHAAALSSTGRASRRPMHTRAGERWRLVRALLRSGGKGAMR